MVREHKYISLDYIINKVKEHPLMTDLNPDTIIANCFTVMRLVGIPVLTSKSICVQPVISSVAKIPADSENVLSVYYSVSPKEDVDKVICKLNDMSEYVESNVKVNRMIHNTDDLAFAGSMNKTVLESYPSFVLNNNRIVTNKRQGSVVIVYNSYAKDNNGIPLALDKESLLLAMENYVKKEYFGILYDLGKLPNRASLETAAQNYAWYVGQTQSELAGFQSDAEVQSFLNGFVKLYKEETNFYYRDAFDNRVQLRKPL